MPNKENLNKAKTEKNDEFYTLYEDIEKEINAYLDYNSQVFKDKVILCPCNDPQWSNFSKYFAHNFEKLGLKKLITTSYISEFGQEGEESHIKAEKIPETGEQADVRAKIYTLSRNKGEKVGYMDIKWEYLEGNGDFRSRELTRLRDEADFIITNPPFSLFREFVAWVIEANKGFLVIGNINCIAYKEIFPLLKEHKAWLGTGIGRWISGFAVPQGYDLYGTESWVSDDGKRIVSTNSCLWLTNIEHGKRHEPLPLMTTADNIRFSKHKEVRNVGYKRYDNYDAIDVPFTDAIPSDYDGIMGVPLTFMDKFCPEQFEILGAAMSWSHCAMTEEQKKIVGYKDIKSSAGTKGYGIVDGVQKYHRILIRKVKNNG